MFRRGFWVALGFGAGATGAVLASRWTKKQAARVAPATLAREAQGGLLDLGKRRRVRGIVSHGVAAPAGRERSDRD